MADHKTNDLLRRCSIAGPVCVRSSPNPSFLITVDEIPDRRCACRGRAFM